MLSAQRDRLRELADRLDGLAPENAALIRSAADTIWELRCKLNDEQDENDRLRELVRDMVLLAGLNGCDVTKMQLHAHGGDWRTVWERMSELGVPGTGVDHD